MIFFPLEVGVLRCLHAAATEVTGYCRRTVESKQFPLQDC
jgi:hypothetical protein